MPTDLMAVIHLTGEEAWLDEVAPGTGVGTMCFGSCGLRDTVQVRQVV